MPCHEAVTVPRCTVRSSPVSWSNRTRVLSSSCHHHVEGYAQANLCAGSGAVGIYCHTCLAAETRIHNSTHVVEAWMERMDGWIGGMYAGHGWRQWPSRFRVLITQCLVLSFKVLLSLQELLAGAPLALALSSGPLTQPLRQSLAAAASLSTWPPQRPALRCIWLQFAGLTIGTWPAFAFLLDSAPGRHLVVMVQCHWHCMLQSAAPYEHVYAIMAAPCLGKADSASASCCPWWLSYGGFRLQAVTMHSCRES